MGGGGWGSPWREIYGAVARKGYTCCDIFHISTYTITGNRRNIYFRKQVVFFSKDWFENALVCIQPPSPQTKSGRFCLRGAGDAAERKLLQKNVWYGSGSPCIWNPTLRLSNEQVRASPGTPVLHINLPLKTLNELILALGPTPAPRLCECIGGFIIGVVVAVAA